MTVLPRASTATHASRAAHPPAAARRLSWPGCLPRASPAAKPPTEVSPRADAAFRTAYHARVSGTRLGCTPQPQGPPELERLAAVAGVLHARAAERAALVGWMVHVNAAHRALAFAPETLFAAVTYLDRLLVRTASEPGALPPQLLHILAPSTSAQPAAPVYAAALTCLALAAKVHEDFRDVPVRALNAALATAPPAAAAVATVSTALIPPAAWRALERRILRALEYSLVVAGAPSTALFDALAAHPGALARAADGGRVAPTAPPAASAKAGAGIASPPASPPHVHARPMTADRAAESGAAAAPSCAARTPLTPPATPPTTRPSPIAPRASPDELDERWPTHMRSGGARLAAAKLVRHAQVSLVQNVLLHPLGALGILAAGPGVGVAVGAALMARAVAAAHGEDTEGSVATCSATGAARRGKMGGVVPAEVFAGVSEADCAVAARIVAEAFGARDA